MPGQNGIRAPPLARHHEETSIKRTTGCGCCVLHCPAAFLHLSSSTISIKRASKRMLQIAFDETQSAMMWLNRAVFQPTRVKLSTDEIDA